jgi:hypothetical protein
MRTEDLRDATKAAAEKKVRKLETRLSPGEKSHRKRMAQVATVYSIAPFLPAGAAFFLLVAHAGLGLQLRDERLCDRVKKRRAHTASAILIALAVTIHVVALERAR